MTRRDDKQNGPKVKQTYRFWTHDVEYVRQNFDNINLAMRRAVREFVERHKRKRHE